MDKAAIAAEYAANGHCFPLPAMSGDQALRYRETFLELFASRSVNFKVHSEL